jgi:thiol-disulfide isomerase/thioredoxin
MADGWQGRAQLAATAGVAALSVLAGFAGVYVTLRGSDNVSRTPALAGPAQAETKAEPLPTGPGTNAYSTGHMTAFVFKAPEALPEIAFVDASGKAMTQKDWQGRVVLVNLWATWCAPCRKEMPALDRLQAALGSDKFEVVALSVDRGGIAASRRFLDQIKVEKLKLYVDATGRASGTLKAIGLPTTLLVRDGREIGRLVGPAEWDSPEAKRLIEAALR